MSARARRAVYRVKPPLGGKRYGWRLEHPTRTVDTYDTKALAVSWGRRKARNLWEFGDTPSQLVVHGRDGRIQTEHTYGHDPERRRG